LSSNRSSNRRRGRGNRSQGGNQLNRIDSRARGNAPQLLEKYKKLAHDAAVNGDRVQSEYYLQFADHYFRVIADSRAQKEEQRAKRDSDRDQLDDDDFDNEDERQDYRGRSHRRDRDRDARSNIDEGERGHEGADSDEEEENPFVGKKQGKPRRERQPRGNGSDDSDESDGGNNAGLDPSALPPSIGKDGGQDGGDKPRRTRRPRGRTNGDDGDETLEAVG
jgi:hypothetical protein